MIAPITFITARQCPATWGQSLQDRGEDRRAVLVISEALSLLRSQPQPNNDTWAEFMVNACCILGNIHRLRGRLAEAAAAFEEGWAVQRVTQPDCHPAELLGSALARVFLDMKLFRRVVRAGLETEQVMDRVGRGTASAADPSIARHIVKGPRAMLAATLAEAFDGLNSPAHSCATSTTRWSTPSYARSRRSARRTWGSTRARRASCTTGGTWSRHRRF